MVAIHLDLEACTAVQILAEIQPRGRKLMRKLAFVKFCREWNFYFY